MNILKFTISSIIAILITCTWTASLPIMAEQPADREKLPPLSINVKDFGAKGDGISDDTDAIQLAVNAVASHTKAYPRMWGAGYPELVFPSGNI